MSQLYVKLFGRAFLTFWAVIILAIPGISGVSDGVPLLEEDTISLISRASRELLSSDIVGEGELHGEATTDGLPVSAWLFSLDNGDMACFEVPDDRSCLFINMGCDNGTFRVEFGHKVTLGEQVF
nr:hypothetical protein [uncultured Dethiosulfovibrio sp.]